MGKYKTIKSIAFLLITAFIFDQLALAKPANPAKIYSLRPLSAGERKDSGSAQNSALTRKRPSGKKAVSADPLDGLIVGNLYFYESGNPRSSGIVKLAGVAKESNLGTFSDLNLDLSQI
jgi:hypothetical protein